MRPALPKLAILLMGPALSPAAHLSQPAADAFGRYITGVEARLRAGPDQHVAISLGARAGAPVDREPELSANTVRIEPVNGGSWEVNGGLLHHWRAAALVPGASPNDMLALLRDPSRLSQYYAPQMVSSRVLTDGGGKRTTAMRFKKRQIVTIVLDAEFETESGVRQGRGYSFSRSRHIWQVDQPGTAQESRRAEGSDDGFLWRLNSYWSFEQKSEGLFLECEAVSLTRDVPAGLGWLIMPIVKTLPRASLEFTLTATQNALAAKRKEEAHQ